MADTKNTNGNTSKALTIDPRQRNLKSMLTAAAPAMRGVMPKYLDAERMVRIALMCTNRTPALLACSPQSILGAVMQSAQLGLEIGGVNGHAYMVPFKGHAQLVPGYKGLIQLVWRGAKIDISADVVYADDEFDFRKGTEPYLNHVPALDPDPGGEVEAAYATARFPDGRIKFEVMGARAIDEIRKRAASSKSSSPWDTDWDEMAKKTVIKRLIKTLPVSDDKLAKAVEIDTRADQGQATPFDIAIEIPAEPEETEPKPPNGKSGDRVAAIREQGKGAASENDGEDGGEPNDDEKAQILADERAEEERRVADAAEIVGNTDSAKPKTAGKRRGRFEP